jgi:hypothetical protein
MNILYAWTKEGTVKAIVNDDMPINVYKIISDEPFKTFTEDDSHFIISLRVER